jgi:hypothetical protein
LYFWEGEGEKRARKEEKKDNMQKIFKKKIDT